MTVDLPQLFGPTMIFIDCRDTENRLKTLKFESSTDVNEILSPGEITVAIARRCPAYKRLFLQARSRRIRNERVGLRPEQTTPSRTQVVEVCVESDAERVLLWTPASIGRSVRTGNDHQIAVRVTHPALPMIRAAFTVGRIPMPWHRELDAHLGGALHDGVEIVHLEPQQDPVSIWSDVPIGNRTVMVFYVEAV